MIINFNAKVLSNNHIRMTLSFMLNDRLHHLEVADKFSVKDRYDYDEVLNICTSYMKEKKVPDIELATQVLEYGLNEFENNYL